jgi:hypothetical protein
VALGQDESEEKARKAQQALLDLIGYEPKSPLGKPRMKKKSVKDKGAGCITSKTQQLPNESGWSLHNLNSNQEPEDHEESAAEDDWFVAVLAKNKKGGSS